jgi:hypothetical protein
VLDYSDKDTAERVKTRIIDLYRTWLGYYWWDVRIECPALGSRISTFLRRVGEDATLASVITPLLDRCRCIVDGVEQKLSMYGFQDAGVEPKPPKLPKSAGWKLIDLNPVEFARQLALVHSFCTRYLNFIFSCCFPTRWHLRHLLRHLWASIVFPRNGTRRIGTESVPTLCAGSIYLMA